jgi:hypothetical protein
MARYLFGHDFKPRHDASVRPKNRRTYHQTDIDIIRAAVEELGAKTLLEFGPGNTTERFLEMGLRVTSVEHIKRWRQEARERFKNTVRILRGHDEIPFRVDDLSDDEKFDLAFVDAPAGYDPNRKVHKGYEDCSRFNTTLFALQRCPVVFLHDANRPLERGTLSRLHRMGYQWKFTNSEFGMARIWRQEQT